MQTLKVGIVAGTDWQRGLPMGGYSRVILSLLPYLRGNIFLLGMKIRNKTAPDFESSYPNARIYPIFNVKYPSGIPLRFKSLCGYWASRHKIRKINFDLLYVHTSESALPFLFGKDMPPVLFHQHGFSNPLTNSDYAWARNIIGRLLFEAILKTVYTRSNAIISIDKKCFERSQRYGVESKTFRLNNPIDTKTFFWDPHLGYRKRRAFKINPKTKVIVFSGRLAKIKNIDTIIGAMSLAHSTNNKWVLLLAGDGPMKQILEKKAKESGLHEKIFFLGAMPYASMPDIYNMADAIVLPSSKEGVPMSLLEAIACGTPVVATKVGGIPEIVKPYKNGILIDEPSKQCVYKGLEKCFRHKWDQRAVVSSVSHCSAVQVAAELYHIFNQVAYDAAANTGRTKNICD